MTVRRKLRGWVEANPALTVVLLAAACLLYVGIWRVSHHQLIPDEMAATTQPFLAFTDEPGLRKFEKGGNLHVWLLVVVYLPVLAVHAAYWLATGQFEALVEAAYDLAGYSGGQQWYLADPRVLDAYYALVATGRFVSATAGLATVLGVALLARRCYDRPAGVLAAATLSVSLGFVLTAKFATEDVLAGCLLVWTLLALARYHQEGSERALVAGAGLAGLAISAKATTGLLVVPVAILALRHERVASWDRPEWLRLRRLARYPVIAIGVYVATTPSLLVHPRAYVAELARYTSVRSGDATYYAAPDPGPIAHAGHLATALGGPLLVLSLVSIVVVAALAATGRVSSFAWYPLGIAAGYGLLISSWSNVQYNRALLLVPLLALFVGIAGAWALDRDRPRLRTVAAPVLAVVLLSSLVYTGLGAAEWSTSRAEASEWTAEHVGPGDTVATLSQPMYGPTLPDSATAYRTPIDPLYDGYTEAEKRRAMQRVRCRQVDFVVLTSFHYARYFEDPSLAPDRTAFYRALLEGELGYEPVATFGPSDPTLRKDAAGRLERAFRLQPPARNTNNPRIVIMERHAPSDGDCPSLSA